MFLTDELMSYKTPFIATGLNQWQWRVSTHRFTLTIHRAAAIIEVAGSVDEVLSDHGADFQAVEVKCQHHGSILIW
jgi:hypothetical protein